MQDCVRITGGVTVDCNVYVRSQRRWRIDHAWRLCLSFVDYVYHFILFGNIFILPILFELFLILLLPNINHLTLKCNTKPWFSRHN